MGDVEGPWLTAQLAAMRPQRFIREMATIQSDAGLNQTIEQLDRMYRVVEELRKRMGTTNPAQFRLFAEGPIDQIRKLREEIDEYLGIQEPATADPG